MDEDPQAQIFAVESALYSNCLLLGYDAAKMGVDLSRHMFRHSNPKGGEAVLYFLLSCIRPQQYQKVMWPPLPLHLFLASPSSSEFCLSCRFGFIDGAPPCVYGLHTGVMKTTVESQDLSCIQVVDPSFTLSGQNQLAWTSSL